MVKLPYYVELYDIIEFSRLVCALERISRTSFSFVLDGREVISVQMDILKEKPVNYYVPNQKFGHYLSYGFKSGREDCDVVNTITNSTYLYSPIVRMKSLPESLKPETKIEPEVMYEPLELEDLTSLIKLSYGFEESPFPLIAFADGSRWLVGVFMNFNESDETSYFCHVKLDRQPASSFLKYSGKDGTEPSFVSGINEHGYSYLKVIKLKGKHPLVKL
jgi:hypothetical protein